MEDTKSYRIALLSTIKLTRKKLDEKREEFGRWENRLNLARGSGKSDLERRARESAEILSGEIADLETEEREYLRELARLDPRFDPAASAFRELAAEAELEAMKKSIEEEEQK